MTVAGYTTDLAEINTAETTTSWSAIGTGAISREGDYYIQGSYCISKVAWSTDIRGQIYNRGSGATITTPAAVFAWIYYACPNALGSEAAGGIRIIIGSSATAYKNWYVKGSDTYTYGGWVNYAVDPSVTSDTTTGSPSSTLQYFGALGNVTGSVSKGNPFGIDVIRYGRTLQITDGDGTGSAPLYSYGTFVGAASTNDSTSNRWGLFQAIDGGYLQKGLFLMGTSGTAVDFRDTNRNISIQDSKKVASTFNTFEIRNASSNVSWTNINITSLGTTSRGDYITTDNATVALTTCVFTDMGTFGFLGNTTVTSCTFRRCNLITQSSAIITGCTIDSTNDSVKALLSNNLTNVTNCTFKSSGTKHAIELNTATGVTYYIDASDVAVTDPNSVWTNDAEAYNGDTSTGATTTTAGSTSSNYLMAEGTNAPGSGSSITSVYARIYGSVASGDTLSATIYTNTLGESLGTVTQTATSAGWGSYVALSTPSGGWDWTKAGALESKIYKTGTAGTATAYRIDIAVLTGGYTSTGNDFIDYATSDGTSGNEVIYNNSSGTILISVASGDTPTIRNGTGANTIVVSSATVTIHVEDVNQTNIQNARVYVTRNSDSSLIINGEQTNASGNVSGSTVAGAGVITVRVRKSSTGSTKYLPVQTTGNVTGSALTVNVILTQDSIAAT